MSGVEWRYVPGGRETVKHALTYPVAAAAVCGVTLIPSSDWLGTGSQREYERVEELRPCRRCLALLGRTAGEVTAMQP